ncbi:MAG: 1-aminocyclopropane-1-carboxylate deaminase/D-cysteine desulfhydrase [Bdellovibrionales bacterium]
MSEPQRLKLGLYPTPLFKASRLSHYLELKLYFKHESQAHFAMGGNKVRAIEYLFGDHTEWDAVVLAGGPQSNFIRAASSAAKVLGKDVHCAFYGRQPEVPLGNYRLLQLLNATCAFSQDDLRESSEALAVQIARDLKQNGRRVKLVARGGASPESTFGFYKLQLELERQLEGIGVVDHLIVPVGTGSMLSGLWIDRGRLLQVRRIWGISCSRPQREVTLHCRTQAQACARKFGLSETLKNQVEITDRYLGAGYHQWSPEISDTIALVARQEGWFLDPVFGAKAFVGLLSLLKEGQIKKNETVVFLNGGGEPEIFARE